MVTAAEAAIAETVATAVDLAVGLMVRVRRARVRPWGGRVQQVLAVHPSVGPRDPIVGDRIARHAVVVLAVVAILEILATPATRVTFAAVVRPRRPWSRFPRSIFPLSRMITASTHWPARFG